MTGRPDALALVAHEVAGALAPARNALDLARSPGTQTRPDDVGRFLDIAARSLSRATRVLDNLVAIAAPHAFVPRVEMVSLPALLTPLLDDFATEAAARGITLQWECEKDLEVPTDAACVEQILANLIGNAVKFTAPGGRVTVRAEKSRGPVLPGRLSLLGGGFGLKPRLVCIEVRDTGIGLSDEAREHAFEPYFRAPEARAAGAPGLGLGLSVGRDLARLVHGDLRIGACADAQGGARFVVTRPADVETAHLVQRLDALFDELQARLATDSQSLVVLRLPASTDSTARHRIATELAAMLPEAAPALTALSSTTW